MRRTLYLIKTDFISISREGTLLVISLVPLIIFMLIRLFIPMLESFLSKEYQFDLTQWYPVGLSFFIQFPPMLLGMAMGYVLLDERDENILEYISVTPAGKLNFLLSKVVVPVFMSIVYVFVLVHGTELIQYPVWGTFPVSILTSLQGPMLMLALASIASNKIEGLAVGKLLSVFLILPVVSLFLPGFWGWFFIVLPGWWVMKLFLAIMNHDIGYSTGYFVGGLIMAMIYNMILYYYYNRKIG